MRSRWLGSAAVFVGVVLLSADRSIGQPPGGGGGGFPGGKGGGPGGGFGAPGGGGMRGNINPEQMWQFVSGGKDTIDINQNPMLKAQYERRGEPLPPGGILTKQQFIDGMQKQMAARQQQGGQGGFGGGPQGQPMTMQFNQGNPGFSRGPGGDFGGRSRDDFGGRQRGDFAGGQQGGWPGGPQQGNWGNGPNGQWNPNGGPNGQPGGPGGPGGDGPTDGKKKEKEIDYTQVGIRYGMLPPGLPDWFAELDADKDGQVGLYEWRAAGRKTAEFTALDSDGDGLLAPRELLRGEAIKAEEAKLTAAAEGSDVAPTRAPGSRTGGAGDRPTAGKTDGSPAGKADRGKWGNPGGTTPGGAKKDRGKN